MIILEVVLGIVFLVIGALLFLLALPARNGGGAVATGATIGTVGVGLMLHAITGSFLGSAIGAVVIVAFLIAVLIFALSREG